MNRLVAWSALLLTLAVPALPGPAHAATPVFAPALIIPTDTLSGGVVVGDFNGDTKPDVLAINFTTLSAFLGNGDGTFASIAAPAVSANASLGVAADFNRDDKLDIVITNFTGSNAFVLIGNGDGSFKPPQSLPTGLHPLGIVTRDINRDGFLDLIIVNNANSVANGSVSVYLGHGDGTFTAGTTYPVGRDARAMAGADFNGDGHFDIAIADALESGVSVLLGNGDGTFQAAVRHTVGIGPQSVTAADLNRDGKPDLIAVNNASGTISVLLGNGDGTFAPQVTYAVGGQPRYAVTGDFDGDGHLDVAVTSNTDTIVAVFPGHGDGTLGTPVKLPTGSFPNDLKAVDVNGDGRLDLVVANFVDGSISILINQTPCVLPGCQGYQIGSVVEFYNRILDNFFITADFNEQIAVKDGEAGPGWSTTGDFFRAGGPSLVCRFYGSLSPGPNSHFYTIDPDECQALKDLQERTPATEKRWNFESNDFASTSPIGGGCATGLVPVYRAYNNGFTRGVDSNHRITSNFAAYQDQVANGWIEEGVVMCAASASSAN